MSILVNNIRIPLEADTEEAFRTACARCDLPLGQVTASVYRESLDARRGTITRVLSVLLDGIPEEQALAERINRPDVRYKKPAEEPKPTGSKSLSHRPVVIGLGPAGLFAAHLLAKNGYRPIVLERGDCVEDRDRAVEEFWRGGAFSERSNIQFGEGGAGAYSDGKLMTRIHDPLSEVVLHTLVAHGAPADILTKAKPHIGTDILKDVVRSMREDIIRLGGEVHFRTALTGIIQKNGRLTGILADGQESSVRAVLSMDSTEQRKFHVTNITVTDTAQSDAKAVELMTQELTVTLVGTKKTLDQLNADDIHVVAQVNTAELTAGSHKVGVTIETPNAVSVSGSYSVEVSVWE